MFIFCTYRGPLTRLFKVITLIECFVFVPPPAYKTSAVGTQQGVYVCVSVWLDYISVDQPIIIQLIVSYLMINICCMTICPQRLLLVAVILK